MEAFDHSSALLDPAVASSEADGAVPLWRSLLAAPVNAPPVAVTTFVGDLLALADDGTTALVGCAGSRAGTAHRAGTTVDLDARHIGCKVLMVHCDDGDDPRPIVIGVLRDREPRAPAGDLVELSADGDRMSIRARDKLELRCGAASITLTRAGQVFIEGDYVLTRAQGVNRILGGSVQIN